MAGAAPRGVMVAGRGGARRAAGHGELLQRQHRGRAQRQVPGRAHRDDVTEQLEQHRDAAPMSDQIITFDPPKHTAHRGLLMGLITPKRLKENEEFMWRLADRQLDAVLARRPVRVHRRLRAALHPARHRRPARRARVDHRRCCAGSASGAAARRPGEDEGRPTPARLPLRLLRRALEQLRAQPPGDVLTGMARATFPDGSMPEPVDLAQERGELFTAGQETTVGC